jgi:hypothetical protein
MHDKKCHSNRFRAINLVVVLLCSKPSPVTSHPKPTGCVAVPLQRVGSITIVLHFILTAGEGCSNPAGAQLEPDHNRRRRRRGVSRQPEHRTLGTRGLIHRANGHTMLHCCCITIQFHYTDQSPFSSATVPPHVARATQ